MDINFVIGISVAMLAVCMLCILVVIVPVALQYHKTLTSIQNLVDTVNDDLEPAVKEIKNSIAGVKKTVGKVSEPLTSSINKASVALVSSAHGIVAGIKNYISSCKNDTDS